MAGASPAGRLMVAVRKDRERLAGAGGAGQNTPMKFPADLMRDLAAAKSVAVLTGAGISAESGVPTYRDALTGLWAKYNPRELDTPGAFLRNPKLVWEWYVWRRQLVAQAQPNPGHLALAEMQSCFPEFHLITQNIDGLHQRAGSRKVIELHGNLQRTKCFDEGRVVEAWPETGEVPPRCPHCGGRLRPDIVWFEEPLPEAEMDLAMHAAKTCDVFFTIGTAAVVYPAAALPVEAVHRGATVVEVNLNPTPFTEQAHHVLTGAAGTVLPELLAELKRARMQAEG